MTRVFGRDKIGKRKTTADPYGMTNKKRRRQEQEDRPALVQEDRPTGPYIEALVNPS
jgi:hypothetical protein